MSLMRLAWRTCATQALEGQTSIPDVCDSAINAFSLDGGIISTDKQKPFIAVYTGNGKIEGSAIDGRSLNQNGLTELIIETGVATAMAETGDDGVSMILQSPATDPAMEMLLDIAGFEITAALTNPDNEWGQLFLQMIDNLVKVERNGARNAEDGVRVAGQQIALHANLIQDPVRGCELQEDDVAQKFINMCASSSATHVQQVGIKFAAALAGDAIDYETYFQIEFGLTSNERKDTLGDNYGLAESINTIEGHHAGLIPEQEVISDDI